MVFFAMWKLLNLIRSHLFYFFKYLFTSGCLFVAVLRLSLVVANGDYFPFGVYRFFIVVDSLLWRMDSRTRAQ